MLKAAIGTMAIYLIKSMAWRLLSVGQTITNSGVSVNPASLHPWQATEGMPKPLGGSLVHYFEWYRQSRL
jgi:hypothetical protein